jgi:hypothetical protein
MVLETDRLGDVTWTHTSHCIYPSAMGRSVSHSSVSSLATIGHTQLSEGQIKQWDPSAHLVWTGHAAQEPYPR